MNGLTRRLLAGAAITAAIGAGAFAGAAAADTGNEQALADAQMANAAGRPVVAKARYPYLADRASASLALVYGGPR